MSIDGPAVFEEDESTFIVGPGAKARLLADGSILAEVVLMAQRHSIRSSSSSCGGG